MEILTLAEIKLMLNDLEERIKLLKTLEKNQKTEINIYTNSSKELSRILKTVSLLSLGYIFFGTQTHTAEQQKEKLVVLAGGFCFHYYVFHY